MTAVLLSAGKASRLGDLAPTGCKALLEVRGKTMLDWWRDFFPELVIVCRSEHEPLLPTSVDRVICDDGGGPAVALAAALPLCDIEPTTVIYADTWVAEIPKGDEWCGVGAATGPRVWDVVEGGLVASREVGIDEAALVACGLYRFAEKWRLELALSHELIDAEGEVGLADVVNDLGLPMVPVFGWRDVGEPTGLEGL